MADPKHLREMLEQLHAELQRADSIDDRSRELLRAVTNDIDAVLERSGEAPRGESLVERLRESLGQFEGEHPALTEAVGRVMDALAKMGI